jgi:hypothetical protein
VTRPRRNRRAPERDAEPSAIRPGRDPTGAANDSASPHDGESRYRPDPAGQQPLNVRIELRLVDGPEGRKLRARQAAAIREALRWFAEHRDPEQTDPISQDRPETCR